MDRITFQPEHWQGASAHHEQQLLALVSRLGLHILAGYRGPMPLISFSRHVMRALQAEQELPLLRFTEALKRVLQRLDDEHRLRVLAPGSFPGVGYVYDAADPETWPVRSSR